MIFEPNFQPTLPIPDNAANRALTEEMIRLTLSTSLAAATERFNKRTKGVDLLEDVINAKGYDLMNEKKLKESIEIFKLNTIAFPKSANAFDSLGEAYLESGDKKSAVENYKKSLELNPGNENAREVLKKIQDK
jgi:tetratricopeptide (TPR) repeat protein